MKRVTQQSLKFCTMIYIVTGICCVLMYSDKTNESIIINFREDIVKYKGKSYFAITILLISQFALLVSSLFNFPFTFYALKTNFINLYIMIMKKIKQGNKKNIKNNQLTNKEIKHDNLTTVGSISRIILNFLLYFFILLIVLLTDHLITLCTFVGSTCSNAIILLAPHAFLIKLSNTPIFSFQKIIEKLIFIFGIFNLIGFIYVEIRIFIT